MDNRQKAFQRVSSSSSETFSSLANVFCDYMLTVLKQLRPTCVELSSIALKFKGRLANNVQLLEALENVQQALLEVSQFGALDPKLAEYCFFPLTPIFNETQRASAQCLEVSLRCLEILIEKGWAAELQPALAKQLLIMMTLLAGGLFGQSTPSSPRSEELTVAAFDCIKAIFNALSDTAASSVLDEVAPATIIDQTVYVLLEALMDSESDAVQFAAVQALIILDSRISDRVILASLLPRTVSSLTKVLTPTSEKRRAYFVLRESLHALCNVLRKTMNDQSNKKVEAQEQLGVKTLVLDKSWRKATAGQVKMALANVIRVRTHDRWDVREQLARLCEMICRECHDTLSESIPMLVETLIVLASIEQDHPENKASDMLRVLLEESNEVRDIMKNRLYSWTISLPRAIQENDSMQKERALQRVSFGFKSLTQLKILPDLLDITLANSICDTAALLIKASEKGHRVEPYPVEIDLNDVKGNKSIPTFTPVTAGSGQGAIFSIDLQQLIQQICNNDESLSLAQTMLDRTLNGSKETMLEPFWVLVKMLKATIPEAYIRQNPATNVGESPRAKIWSEIVDELYSFSLPILTEFSPLGDFDWRIPSLALEVVALQALQLGSQFAPELIDVLYPILQVLTTSNPMLKRHAVVCLSVIVSSCGYSSASDLLVGNVDYLVNAISLKLNAFDVSPQAPQVLLLLIQLCGPNLIPFLDDLIASMFAILDAYHGYPKLAESMFSVLRAIVAKGAQSSGQRLVTDGLQERESTGLRPSTQGRDLCEVISFIEKRRKRLDEVITSGNVEIHGEEEEEEIPRRPLGPLSSDMLNDEKEEIEDNTEYHAEEDTEMLPPPKEEEKGLSASHQLLLNIVKSIPPHMSSPSPTLRKSLLEIMESSFVYLSQHEDTFLPLINDLWPTVSARIALPATFVKHTSLITANDDEVTKRPTIDEFGMSEETFVFVNACSTIDAMVRTAKDFMTKRIEDEFPRWKKMYERVWKEVKTDAERKKQQRRVLHNSGRDGLTGNDLQKRGRGPSSANQIGAMA
ncbi:hypothetical protein KEM54_002528, partial [Ascosphaera aggregata]